MMLVFATTDMSFYSSSITTQWGTGVMTSPTTGVINVSAGNAAALRVSTVSGSLITSGTAMTGEMMRPVNQMSKFAQGLQGSTIYPGVDRFRDIVLKKGKIIYGGVPGQSNFYTTESAIHRSGGSASNLFQGLQVEFSPKHGGYRSKVMAYEVMDDVPAAFGRALANPDYGRGRLPQIVLENFSPEVLKPLYSIPLKK